MKEGLKNTESIFFQIHVQITVVTQFWRNGVWMGNEEI